MIQRTTELEGFLNQFAGSGEDILYVSNPGNAGDSLIAAATFQALRAAGLRWRLVDHRNLDAKTTKDALVLYAGGGNLVRYYPDARRFIAAHHRGAGRLVLLPHTIDGHEDLLAELGPNVDLIARDRRSFRHIRAHAPGARHHLMHDIALYLDIGELRSGPLRPAAPPTMRAAARLAFQGWRRLRKRRPPAGRVLNAFRTDREATGIERPTGNFDLSSLYSGWAAPEVFARIAARDFLAIAERYDEIRTNRLHVGIAGALLGKRVILHDNSYGKNRAIWEHSLAGRFSNVEWHESPERMILAA